MSKKKILTRKNEITIIRNVKIKIQDNLCRIVSDTSASTS